MTKLRKPVKREVGSLGLRGGDAGEYIITLYPGGVLGFRRKRSRKEYTVLMASCYSLACKQEAAAQRIEKAKARKAKRANTKGRNG